MRRILNYIPTVLVAGLILYLSLLREPHFHLPPIKIAYLDKLLHTVFYFVLAAVFTCDLWRDRVRFAILISLAIILPVIYGGIIEILQQQYFYPRTGEWFDWGADILGTLLGFALVITIIKIRKKHFS